MSVKAEVFIPQWWLDEHRPSAAKHSSHTVSVPWEPFPLPWSSPRPPPGAYDRTYITINYHRYRLECPKRHQYFLYVADGEEAIPCAACKASYAAPAELTKEPT